MKISHIYIILTKGSYVNFPYNKLNNYNFEYYDINIIKLDLIKKKYDPHNIFSFLQRSRKLDNLNKNPKYI